jgi:glyoxylase-like metal-dependent hydrolase (beta-lactamase superfamily II)
LSCSAIVTHHHPDHTGAINAIIQEYPDIRIAAHIEEKPFLVEGQSGGILPSAEFWFKAAAWSGILDNKLPVWPKEKVR